MPPATRTTPNSEEPGIETHSNAASAARKPQFPAPTSSPTVAPNSTTEAAPKGRLAPPRVSGISLEQVAQIKAAIQEQQKFLGELVEQSSAWELDGAELRIYFSQNNRTFAELLEGRDTLEKVRAVSGNVLGRAVRVCAKLEAVRAAAAAGTQELRARFERDPLVRSMLERFGGKITEVRARQEEN